MDISANGQFITFIGGCVHLPEPIPTVLRPGFCYLIIWHSGDGFFIPSGRVGEKGRITFTAPGGRVESQVRFPADRPVDRTPRPRKSAPVEF